MGEPIANIAVVTKMIRIMVESNPIYSDKPPQTPKSILSVSDFLKRAILLDFKSELLFHYYEN